MDSIISKDGKEWQVICWTSWKCVLEVVVDYSILVAEQIQTQLKIYQIILSTRAIVLKTL
jgi:hypothetical protein